MDNFDFEHYTGLGELYAFAAAEAEEHTPTEECSGKAEARLLLKSCREIRACHAEITRRYGEASSPPAACEWIMDNKYMIEREFRTVYPQLLSARRLRRDAGTSLAGRLCRGLIGAGQGEVTEARLTCYLNGFQSVTVLKWAELRLIPALLGAAAVEGVAEICREMRYAADTTPCAKRLEALFGTLRLLSTLDMEKLINASNVTDRLLSEDASGEYARMDSTTKRAYLERVEALARKENTEEHVFARRIAEKSRCEGKHVGFYLFPPHREQAAGLYIGSIVLTTLFLTLIPAFTFKSAWSAALLFLPVSELVKSLTDYILLRLVPPSRVFRMDTQKGVPPDGRTICVISTLLSGEADAEKLEELYFACRGEGAALSFGLLADLPAADSAVTDEDEALLRPARDAVARLNRKYGARFYLFTRPRSFDGARYSAHERKRGALAELAKLLCDEESALTVTGEKDALSGVKYILTLDSDTRVYPGSVGELIGAMLHPLNRPVIDRSTKTVRAGHAVIHPRIDVDLGSATATDFALIFAGPGGSDPYGGLCGELYMDAFQSGGFAGKGVIDAHALLTCTRDFPENRILSHDAPEGAFLRGAYMGDAEFSDAFPAQPLAYYKRQHRWIRGDWQNTIFIFHPALTDIDRWRLIDSLRRSLIAPATLAAIAAGLLLSDAGLRVAAWAALTALLARLFLSLADGGLRRRSSGHTRRYTRIFTGVGGAIVQTFIRLWLLPYEAWVSMTAIVTALWRMTVTHKKLLEWQTAAQSSGGTSLVAHIRAMYFPMLLGLALTIFGDTVISKAAGLMWFFSPLAAFALALPAQRETELAENERRYLAESARRSYGYFQSFHSADDNYLPPDNFQEQPPVGTARRTSPTNIGLALASHVAACELGIIGRGKCALYTARTLETLERMPRHMGHYYNWYDTASLVPLVPAYISTVDSGNLYAGLLTARQAMLSYGEAGLAARLGAIMAGMDFSPLYDRVRGLFYICYDTSKERGAGGWYDLLASEAMLTSYIAVAKGDVPVRHWRRLSRAQLQKDGYKGLASWTGTMFEYLMPELFLPVYRGSLLYESCRFCVYAQKRRVWAGKPWGVSESAFYSLDSAMNYRYKAHGCAALALKRGQDADMVVSPYSSFLALAIDPQGGIRNLRRLERCGALGRWGFIEALDFTSGRCRSSDGEKVRCYMAHHEGMSVIAAANAAANGCIQRLFMSAPEMNAFSLLLQERADEGGVIISRERADAPERFERGPVARWQLRGGADDRERRCVALSNGAYNIAAENSGKSRAQCANSTIYDCAEGLGAEGGVSIKARTPRGEYLMLPTISPTLWELEEDSCRVTGETEEFEYACSLFAAYGDCGEGRDVTLCAREDMRVVIELSFKPLLAPYGDYVNHPAFWELGICAEREGEGLMLHRLRRGGQKELWLCLAATEPLAVSAEKGGALGALSHPFVSVRAETELKAGQAKTIRFALCLGLSRGESAQGAQRILVSGVNDKGNMLSAAAAHLKMSGEDVGQAQALLERIWPDKTRSAAPKQALWPFGISGDLPIICCDGLARECETLLKSFCLLKSCGVTAELVYLTDEQGEYRRPVFRRVSELLRRSGLESLIGVRGGVHFAPMSAASDVISRAAYTVGVEKDALPAVPWPADEGARRANEAPCFKNTENGFAFCIDGALPPRVWQNVLSNGRFGYIAADCGTGYMWFDNAREMRVNPPPKDINGVSGSEALWADTNGERISLFAADDKRRCLVSFAPNEARWEKDIGARTVRLTAFIPGEGASRVFIVEGAAGLRLSWSLKPVMGAADAKAVNLGIQNGALTAENREAYLPDVRFSALCSRPAEMSCSYNSPAMHMSFIADEKCVIVCGCSDIEKLRALCTPDAALKALIEARKKYENLTKRVRIESPCAALNSYINVWSVYQCLVCRISARASLYQSGGAFGFRDQLQDAVNLLLVSPEYARKRILDCCRHQYVEGDVMHWWHRHPDGDRGVRTRCSDDLLWLVWALCEYTEKTGDLALCGIEEEYISSPPLADSERDRYETPAPSGARASVLDHARAAAERCISRGFGAHGLPKMGAGDWNDGLDEVDGESVWLAWFFADCARRLAALLERLGKPDAARLRKYAEKAAIAADGAWTGRWYARGYFPDGEALGGAERIDSVAQSWAVLSGAASESNRPRVAVDSALHKLIDRGHGLVRLFTPPYSAHERSPGYIASYGEGFRENGGQYTHGAIWLAMACFRLGMANEGWDILSMLLPENHDPLRYGAEPFVLAADVYTAAGHEGEAGWSWYTGSAGWYFRAVFEEMLGLRLKGGKLTISPRLPDVLSAVKARWTDYSGVRHEIEISRGGVTVDGKEYTGGEI